jgi:hypothetical protein
MATAQTRSARRSRDRKGITPLLISKKMSHQNEHKASKKETTTRWQLRKRAAPKGRATGEASRHCFLQEE